MIPIKLQPKTGNNKNIYINLNKNKMRSSLKKDYDLIKAKYPNIILLYKLGSFYESVFEDAKKVSECLGTTLTKRTDITNIKNYYLTGFNAKDLTENLLKLLKNGHKVGIVELIK